MALQNGCMLGLSLIVITLSVATGKVNHSPVAGEDRLEQIRQLLKKFEPADDPTIWDAVSSDEGDGTIEDDTTPGSVNSDWSVNRHDVIDISYHTSHNDDDKSKHISISTKNSKLGRILTRNISVSAMHSRQRRERRLNDLQDSSFWLGMGLGTAVSLAIFLLSATAWALVRRYTRRTRCIDLTELSFCTPKHSKMKTPVYVRLSQLHNPRKCSKDSQYVVSVLDESNNFSIDSESDTSSSTEEEIFNASCYKSSDNSFSSGARVNLTSTPIKGSPISAVRALPFTPPRPRPKMNGPLPLSPLARTPPPPSGSTNKTL